MEYLMLMLSPILYPLGFALLVGGVLALLKQEAPHRRVEGFESWITAKWDAIVAQRRWYHLVFLLQPGLWLWKKTYAWTRPIAHRGLRNGSRVAGMIFGTSLLLLAFLMVSSPLIGLVLYGVMMLLQIGLVLLMGAAIIAVIFFVIKSLIWDGSEAQRSFNWGYNLFNSQGEARETAEPPVQATLRPGTRVNKKTGKIEEDTWLGYTDTGERINQKTGEFEEDSWLGYQSKGIRVHPVSGKIQTKSWLGWEDTGKRVNLETGVVQEDTFLGWVDTDERIDPKSGRHQKDGWLGWGDD